MGAGSLCLAQLIEPGCTHTVLTWTEPVSGDHGGHVDVKAMFCSRLPPCLRFWTPTCEQNLKHYNMFIVGKTHRSPAYDWLGCANCQDAGTSPSPQVSLCWQMGCCPQSTSSHAADHWSCAKLSAMQPNRPEQQSGLSLGSALLFDFCVEGSCFNLKLTFTFNLLPLSGAFTEDLLLPTLLANRCVRVPSLYYTFMSTLEVVGE